MIALFMIALLVCALTANHVVELVADRALRTEIANRSNDALHVNRWHMWVRPEGSGAARVGVDSVGALLLGRTERIEWTASGEIAAGAPLAHVRVRGRRVALPSPVAGTVLEQNPLLGRTPDAIAHRSLDGGWLVRLRPANLRAEVSTMLSGEKLSAWSRKEMDRLRELVLSRLPTTASVGATAADGGPLGPEVANHLDEAAFAEAARMIFGVEVDAEEIAKSARP